MGIGRATTETHMQSKGGTPLMTVMCDILSFVLYVFQFGVTSSCRNMMLFKPDYAS